MKKIKRRGTISYLSSIRRALREERRQVACPLSQSIEVWERQAKRRYRLQRESSDPRTYWQDWEDYLSDRIVAHFAGSPARFGYRSESGIQSDSPICTEEEVGEVLGYLSTVVELSPLEESVISLLCQGESFSAIASQTGVAERSVYRIVARVRTLLFVVSIVFLDEVNEDVPFQASPTNTSTIRQAIQSIRASSNRSVGADDGADDGDDGIRQAIASFHRYRDYGFRTCCAAIDPREEEAPSECTV